MVLLLLGAALAVPLCPSVPADAAHVEYGVPVEVLRATAHRESKCDPRALGGSGEIGLMQVNPSVWESTLIREGIITDSSDLWDSEVNVRAGAYILARLRRRSASLYETLRRYNGAGPAAELYATEQLHVICAQGLRLACH